VHHAHLQCCLRKQLAMNAHVRALSAPQVMRCVCTCRTVISSKCKASIYCGHWRINCSVRW
jgi:hypothetical protein